MVKIIEYAVISQHVYNSNAALFGRSIVRQAKLTKNSQINFSTNGWYIVTDLDPTHTRPANNFFAALYIKFKDGKATDAIIAIRGTVSSNFSNILVDVVFWYSAAAGTKLPASKGKI